jgi:hypothetical protein
MADTLADWNNNPGNLKPAGFTYPGQIGVDSEGFAVFKDKESGHNALLHDVTTKIGRGVNSPEAFVDAYAPKGDNSEEARMNYKINMANELGLKSTNDPFPENSHQKIADMIAKQEGYSAPTPTATQDQSEATTTRQPTAPSTADQAPSTESTSTEGSPIQEPAPGTHTLSPTALSVLGGGLGLATGTAITGATKTAHLAKGIYDRLAPGAVNTPARVEPTIGVDSGVNSANTGVNSANTDSQVSRILQGGNGATEGTTGRARQTGYNVQTAQEAAAKKVAEETAELMKRTGITEMDARQFLAKQPTLTASPSGVLYPKTEAPKTIGPRTYQVPGYEVPNGVYDLGQGNIPSKTPSIPLSAPLNSGESVLGKLGRYATSAGTVLKPLAHIGISGLSGAVGANEIYNAEKDREKNGLTMDNAIDYLSGAGGIVGMVPTLPTQIAAGLMQTPAGLRWLYQHRDKFKPQPNQSNADEYTGGP